MLLLGSSAFAADPLPPPCVEVTPEHPLLVFEAPGTESSDPAAVAQAVASAWAGLNDELKPFSALALNIPDDDPSARHAQYTSILASLQAADVPVVVSLADGNPRRVYPPDLTRELLDAFTCVKAVEATGLAFNVYEPFGDDDSATPAAARWLMETTEVAAGYGRLIVVGLDRLDWPRLMSHAACRPLYDVFSQFRDYVVPVVVHRGPHTIPDTMAVMGLWIEGGAARWGIGATSQWYADAGFLAPGVFGAGATPETIPPSIYRAMLLNGAMLGATVYRFGPPTDLWFGSARRHWDQAIEPTLSEMLQGGLIARKDFVMKKARVAYQLTPSRSPQQFHANLRDIDGVLDQGLLLQGAYGMERPGQVAELIPNSGRHYWLPILSPYASQPVLDGFSQVVQPGAAATADAWITLLDRHYQPDGTGSAFICQVGRGVFIMNTRENLYEEQTFRVPGVPAPVRGLSAERQDANVVLSWPFREGDVAYRIYKRQLDQPQFRLIVNDVDERTWTDSGVDANAMVAYAVTALTNEKETYEGVVNVGDYLALSLIESRIEEEAAITPLLSRSVAQPVHAPPERPKSQTWWPSPSGAPGGEGLSDEQAVIARTIAERIEAMDAAFCAKNLDGLLDLYASDYEDTQRWRFQYVQRAFQWFFERYTSCRMARQIRRWDFARYDGDGQVRVLLYCRFMACAVSDPSGRIADQSVSFPTNPSGEVWLTFAGREGVWRILTSEPALPSMRDILSFSAGPSDALGSGPDVFGDAAKAPNR